MSNHHLTASFRCSKFKGTTRLVLLYLADAASHAKEKVDGKRLLPFGYCKRKRSTIMAAVNCPRAQTVSAAITELKQAGAIKQFRKKYATALYFVDLDWLQNYALTEAQLEAFNDKTDTDQTTESVTS